MNFCIERYLRIKSSPINAIWFIKNNFLEAIKYFKLSIGAIVLFEVFTLAGSNKLKKKLRGYQRGAYIYVWYRVWIMKLLHDCIFDPLKQTKRTLGALPGLPLTQFRVVFDVSVENSWNKRNVWKGAFGYFPGRKIPVGNSDFMSSNLFWILVSGFRGRFSLRETVLGQWWTRLLNGM